MPLQQRGYSWNKQCVHGSAVGRKDSPAQGPVGTLGEEMGKPDQRGRGNRGRKPSGMNSGGWCPDSLQIPFSGATLVHVCVDQRETIQVQPLLSISLFLLRAPHRIKDSFVLIELRPVLFIELWKPFLCSSPFLYRRHCHSQKKVWGKGGGGGREGGREGLVSKNYMGIWSRVCH